MYKNNVTYKSYFGVYFIQRVCISSIGYFDKQAWQPKQYHGYTTETNFICEQTGSFNCTLWKAERFEHTEICLIKQIWHYLQVPQRNSEIFTIGGRSFLTNLIGHTNSTDYSQIGFWMNLQACRNWTHIHLCIFSENFQESWCSLSAALIIL